jgi:hypothetical protein
VVVRLQTTSYHLPVNNELSALSLLARLIEHRNAVALTLAKPHITALRQRTATRLALLPQHAHVICTLSICGAAIYAYMGYMAALGSNKNTIK